MFSSWTLTNCRHSTLHRTTSRRTGVDLALRLVQPHPLQRHDGRPGVQFLNCDNKVLGEGHRSHWYDKSQVWTHENSYFPLYNY